VERQGLTFHSVENEPYWDESAYWEFSGTEIDRLERATRKLQEMCLAAGDRIIAEVRFADMHIPEQAWDSILRSWNEEPPALYGRMDLAFDGHSIKLLEYNADTPTSLVEAAVIQWHWLQDCFAGRDQFNSIHEKLVAKWKDLKPYVAEPIYFAHEEVDEDLITVSYLRDTASQAGLRNVAIAMRQVGWFAPEQSFVDLGRQPMGTIFKLYPWEKMLTEPFGKLALQTMARGQHAQTRATQWIEPIWKMLWSNKALLAVLWEMFPGHEYLLPAYLDSSREMKQYVRKPLFGREGSNIQYKSQELLLETPGPYMRGPWLYQGLAPLPCVDGNWAVCGSWLVDGEPCGLGVREARSPVVRNVDRFVPHLF